MANFRVGRSVGRFIGRFLLLDPDLLRFQTREPFDSRQAMATAEFQTPRPVSVGSWKAFRHERIVGPS